jgi:hypothetical protein
VIVVNKVVKFSFFLMALLAEYFRARKRFGTPSFSSFFALLDSPTRVCEFPCDIPRLAYHTMSAPSECEMLIFDVDAAESKQEEKKSGNAVCVARASELLLADEVVAFPTETVYGLGANCYSDAAVGKIFRAKGRPSDNPLIVHIHSRVQLEGLCDVSSIPDYATRLMEAFWPGSLTMIFRVDKDRRVSELVTCGLGTVAGGCIAQCVCVCVCV